MLAPDRSRYAWRIWVSSAGSVLRLQEGSGEDGLSRCARGTLLFASKARSGPFPLPLGVWGCLEMTEAELSNLMQHDPIERPRSKTTSSV